MIVTSVTVYVKNEHVDAFIAATVENHEASVKEQGNMRFDVLQSMDDPSTIGPAMAVAGSAGTAAVARVLAPFAPALTWHHSCPVTRSLNSRGHTAPTVPLQQPHGAVRVSCPSPGSTSR